VPTAVGRSVHRLDGRCYSIESGPGFKSDCYRQRSTLFARGTVSPAVFARDVRVFFASGRIVFILLFTIPGCHSSHSFSAMHGFKTP
jgi:hypothetical protein